MNDLLTLVCGDAVESLKALGTGSVQCCVTSPPYWGLRDYGTAQWEGGDDGCDHQAPAGVSGGQRADRTFTLGEIYKNACGKCGAKRIDSQLGLEKTPEEYVAKMVEVFREVRRVLRKDGTLWLNLGSSMAGSWGNYHPDSPPGKHGQRLKETARWNRPAYSSQEFLPPTANEKHPIFKPKDLVPIPWMVAMALQADGWWLRSDIIWAKPNPMPESVTDRCTKSHEYIFMLTKSASYFWDSEAIKEKTEQIQGARPFGGAGNGKQNLDRQDYFYQGDSGNRNKRSVWTIATAPYPEAHFATFPPEIPKLCILAGSRIGDTILDPFAGSGTTGAVALELGRKAVLIELNPKYCDLIRQRCDVTPGLQLA